MLDQVKLTAELITTPERLTIAFTVTNGRDGDIYVIDRAFRIGPQGVAIRPDHLVVTFGDPGLAVLSTKLPPFNPAIQWATPPTVYATPVRAKQRYTHEVGAPLPLRADGWHVPRDEQGRVLDERVRKDICTRLLFELGVIPAQSGVAAPASEFAGVPVVQLGAQVAKQQVVLAFEWSGVEVPCMK